MFDDNAQKIWDKQYALTPGEPILEGFWRAAGVSEETRTQIYAMMTEKQFCPGGRVLAGAGTEHQNTNNCYVFASDTGRFDTLDDVENLTLKLARTTKVGGGNGLNLDPFPASRGGQRNEGTFILAIQQDHPDAENLKAWRFRDVTKPEGQQWIENRPMVGISHVIAYRDADDAQRQLDDLGYHYTKLDVPDSIDGIVTTAFQAMRVQAESEYATVLDLTALRPEGSAIKGSGGTSSGAASFGIEVFENFLRWWKEGAQLAGPVKALRYVFSPTLRVVRQGGVRRGAGMATFSIRHDDWADFLSSKDLDREANEGDISTFNISFLVDDAFMEKAVVTAEQQAQVDAILAAYEGQDRAEPDALRRGELASDVILALEGVTPPLPDEAVRLIATAVHAWMTGEPGLIYETRVNENNPLLAVDGPIKATNPLIFQAA